MYAVAVRIISAFQSRAFYRHLRLSRSVEDAGIRKLSATHVRGMAKSNNSRPLPDAAITPVQASQIKNPTSINDVFRGTES